MTQIGIDYSLNAPAFCITNLDTKEYKIIAFLAANLVGKKDQVMIDEINKFDGVDVILFENPKFEDVNGETHQIIKNVDFVFNRLQEYIQPNWVAIFEGFSYMSKSSKLYQFAGSNYYMRKKFIENGNIIHTATPASVKKLAGKGNAKKDQMVEFFLERDDNESQFKDWLRKYWAERTTKKIMKPLDDIVDSYYISLINIPS